MSVFRFSIDNPLIINLSLIMVLIIGVISWRLLPQEVFPNISLDMVNIQTLFDGASPEEVEQQITISIEEQFKNSQDIDFINSSSNEGISSIL